MQVFAWAALLVFTVATGALIVSAPAANGATTVTTVPAEPGAPSPDSLEISGVAPGAHVLPVRCVDFVFVLDNVDLVRGAEYLVEPEDPVAPAKVGVISMSVGGVPHFTLEDVLNVGVRDKNVIAVAAAGQIYAGHLPVVAPAAYPGKPCTVSPAECESSRRNVTFSVAVNSLSGSFQVFRIVLMS